MRLTIERGQTLHTDRKGRSEGASFDFSCRLHLDPHETELMTRYKQERHPLTFLQMDDIRDFNPRNTDDRVLTVERLMQGWSVTSRFSGDLRGAEEAITAGCAEFKQILLSMEAYGGRDEIEF